MVEFGSPKALWLLALAVPVILFHFYRGRIRRLPVPTLLFWEQVLQEEERASALKRLRHYLTLLLSLLALAVLVTALADPTVRGVTPEVRPVAIVIDTAPELAARESDGRTRIDIAREKALALAAGLYRRSPAALYDAGGLVEPAATDRDRLERALAQLPRPVAAGPLADVVAAARAASPEASIYVFTARPFAAPDANTRVVPVGTPRPNRALRSPSTSPGAVSAIAVNESAQPADATLVVRNRGRVLTETPLKLTPRESRPITWALDAKAFPNEKFELGAFVELALVPEDAYPPDDAVSFVIPPAAPPIVVVISRAGPDPHLWSALHLMDDRSMSIPPEKLAETRERLGDSAVYIFDRTDPPEPFDAGMLLISCGPMGAEVENPKLVDWDRRAPVHRLVDYSDVILRRAHILTGEPLVTSDRGPLAVAGRAMGRAWIQSGFGFGVADGDFALKPSFPIFLRNAIAWLGGDGRRAFPREARVGEVVVNGAPLPPGLTEVSVTTVSGSQSQTSTVPVDRDEARIVPLHPGLVKVAAGPKTEWLVARLAASPNLEQLPREEGVALPKPLPWWRNLPYPAVAGALVLLILVVEWWLYQSGR